MNIGDTYNFNFSPDGKRAISKRALFDDWNCYSCTWVEPNGATRVCTLINMGTVYSVQRAQDWLDGKDVELNT
jgi:hypothetical protein